MVSSDNKPKHISFFFLFLTSGPDSKGIIVYAHNKSVHESGTFQGSWPEIAKVQENSENKAPSTPQELDNGGEKRYRANHARADFTDAHF